MKLALMGKSICESKLKERMRRYSVFSLSLLLVTSSNTPIEVPSFASGLDSVPKVSIPVFSIDLPSVSLDGTIRLWGIR